MKESPIVPPHILKVVEEQNNLRQLLGNGLISLGKHFKGELPFDLDEKQVELQQMQFNAMMHYDSLLSERIKYDTTLANVTVH